MRMETRASWYRPSAAAAALLPAVSLQAVATGLVASLTRLLQQIDPALVIGGHAVAGDVCHSKERAAWSIAAGARSIEKLGRALRVLHEPSLAERVLTAEPGARVVASVFARGVEERHGTIHVLRYAFAFLIEDCEAMAAEP